MEMQLCCPLVVLSPEWGLLGRWPSNYIKSMCPTLPYILALVVIFAKKVIFLKLLLIVCCVRQNAVAFVVQKVLDLSLQWIECLLFILHFQ